MMRCGGAETGKTPNALSSSLHTELSFGMPKSFSVWFFISFYPEEGKANRFFVEISAFWTGKWSMEEYGGARRWEKSDESMDLMS